MPALFSTQTKVSKPKEPEKINTNEKLANNMELVYTGKNALPLKILSLSGCTVSIIFGVIMILNPTNVAALAAMRQTSRAFIGALVMSFGISTSVVLHMFCRNIITKLYYNKTSGDIQLEVVNLWLRTTTYHSTINELKKIPSTSPSVFVNVQCHKNQKKFWLDPTIIPNDLCEKIFDESNTKTQALDKEQRDDFDL
ncbi:hypothetical protein RFI_30372 [Reticulomyxa filosa]|uniref:Transmembrane protein n=1 Tax=Reticulomyxa filosa TaxID=46433 RepID=X6LZI4_RETFI|nr:hypothetical protein RFI_30372 [Reticulomyxa filosa]|eukprot:ETO07019.1 hypothetical protein RFI_30372 [Reticulomyxa filosa]